MAEQWQSFGPGRVLAQVTLIVALPLLGGVVAGLVIDGISGTAPLFVLTGMAIGSLVAAIWLRSFISSTAARLRTGMGATDSSTHITQQSTDRSTDRNTDRSSASKQTDPSDTNRNGERTTTAGNR